MRRYVNPRPIGMPRVLTMTPHAVPLRTYPSFTGLSAFELTSSEFWYLAIAMGAGAGIAHALGQSPLLGAGVGALTLLVIPTAQPA